MQIEIDGKFETIDVLKKCVKGEMRNGEKATEDGWIYYEAGPHSGFMPEPDFKRRFKTRDKPEDDPTLEERVAALEERVKKMGRRVDTPT